MAETCPHCGTDIAGQLIKCPNCGCDCLATQEFCPECETPLQRLPQELPQAPLSDPSVEEEEEEEEEVEESGLKTLLMRKEVMWGAAAVVLLIMLCTGIYFFNRYRTNQSEQADYERLEGTTNPEFYQKFLNDYPDGKYYDEINARMHILLSEAEDWNALLKNVNKSGIKLFMQKYPESLHLRTCEDLLDSIDWQAALAADSEEAINRYLTDHPSGRYVDQAAEKKNAILLAKVSASERAKIRGTLLSFFSNAIGDMDIDAARAKICEPFNFNGRQDANAETIIEYARNKMESDVFGLHYEIAPDMDIRKVTLSDNDVGYTVNATLNETISRSDTKKPTEKHYQVSATLNYAYKIVRIVIL